VIVDLPLGVQVRLDIAAGRRSRGTGDVLVIGPVPCDPTTAAMIAAV